MVSKIFENLILKRILDIQNEQGVDITNVNQHGFKKNHSASTLSAALQSEIARSQDDENYVMMANLDLSSDFDLVNMK